MRLSSIALALAALALLTLAPPALAAPKEEAAPMEFSSYSFVTLKKGPHWSTDDTPENNALQAAHLAHLSAMADAGHMLVAGPFSDQVDETIRGICIYRVPLEEARAFANADPRVEAGHLVVEVMTWWTQKGAVAFPLAAPAPKSANTAPAE